VRSAGDALSSLSPFTEIEDEHRRSALFEAAQVELIDKGAVIFEQSDFIGSRDHLLGSHWTIRIIFGHLVPLPVCFWSGTTHDLFTNCSRPDRLMPCVFH
jgi:hypothetical protein